MVEGLGDGVVAAVGDDEVDLRQDRPDLRFSLEMITRDPLRIPCLTQDYWETLFEFPMTRTRPARDYVRERYSKSPLPRITQLADAGQLSREDENVVASLRYARERLGL